MKNIIEVFWTLLKVITIIFFFFCLKKNSFWLTYFISFEGTVADGAPIVPISAQLKYNVDAINEYIVKKIPIPVRDFTSDPRLIVIRSFDVNKPGAEVDELKGGVAGGSILRGVLKVKFYLSNPY